MKMEELFEGFDAEKQKRYEAELVDRYGEGMKEHIADSKNRMKGWSKEDADRFMQEWQDVATGLGRLFVAGKSIDDPETQQMIDRHCRWIRLSWAPNRESYTGLGQLYADAPEFREQIDAHAEGLAEWVRDAMAHYAQERL